MKDELNTLIIAKLDYCIGYDVFHFVTMIE